MIFYRKKMSGIGVSKNIFIVVDLFYRNKKRLTVITISFVPQILGRLS